MRYSICLREVFTLDRASKIQGKGFQKARLKIRDLKPKRYDRDVTLCGEYSYPRPFPVRVVVSRIYTLYQAYQTWVMSDEVLERV